MRTTPRRGALLAGVLLLALTVIGGTFPAGAHATGTGAPEVGTEASSVELRTVPGSVEYGSGHAIPLEGARPAWYTNELRQTVSANGGRPVMAPAQAPLPGTIGIRPGSWMIDPAGCTMNFIFRSGADLGIGTAGHCASKGDNVVLLTLAPGGSNPVLVDIGTVVLSHDNGVGDDFALVRIRPHLHSWVDPTIAVVAGPCGAFGGSGAQTVLHYGHGLGIGTGGTPRAGVALTWRADAYGWDGAAIFGDSGSPVRIGTFPAAGNLTHLVVDTRWLPSFIVGTRIGKIDQINGGWSLVSSSLCP
jgi:hypothetical protein